MGILDTDCPECLERRRQVAAWIEASKQWAMNPTGPSVQQLAADILNQKPSPSDSTNKTD